MGKEADPKHLGARIGILSVLHTWGSALTHHPMLPFGKTQKREIALLRRSVTSSQPNSRPCRVAKLRTLPPRSATSTPAPAAKSP
jgi:hypothetical protein